MSKLKREQKNRIKRELRKLLSDNPDGIPVDKLQVYYSQTFHKNLSLKEAGMKMADITIEFKDIIEQVTINRAQCLRLKGVGRGAATGHGEKAVAKKTTAVSGASKSDEKKNANPHVSKKPVPLTVPQYAFEPVMKSGAARAAIPSIANPPIADPRPAIPSGFKYAPAAKTSAAFLEQIVGVPMVSLEPDSLEAKMQQYMSNRAGGLPAPAKAAGPHNVFQFGSGGEVGGGAPGIGGFMFDQGSILSDYNPNREGTGAAATGGFTFGQGSILGDYDHHQGRQDSMTVTRTDASAAVMKQRTKDAILKQGTQDAIQKGKSTNPETWQDVKTKQDAGVPG